jgi:hypothetical protein
MPIHIFHSAISGNLSDIAEKMYKIVFNYFGIFYPPSEPISPHRSFNAWVEWVGPFAVYKYSFMGHFLASANIRVERVGLGS